MCAHTYILYSIYLHTCMHAYIDTNRQTYRHTYIQTYRHTHVYSWRFWNQVHPSTKYSWWDLRAALVHHGEIIQSTRPLAEPNRWPASHFLTQYIHTYFVWIYTYTYIFIYTQTFLHIYIYIYYDIHFLNMHICIYIYMYICICVLYLCMYIWNHCLRYGTSTGRLSCSNPNLQGIPADSKDDHAGPRAGSVGAPLRPTNLTGFPVNQWVMLWW